MLTPRIHTLFRAWMDRTASSSEQDELLRELNALSDEDLEMLLEDAYAGFEPRQGPFSSDRSEFLLATIRETTGLQEEGIPKKYREPVLIHRPWWHRYGAAAAVMLFLVLGITIYRIYIHRQVQPPIAKEIYNDVVPGGNKAILTLAGGKQIVLDSAANGTLAQEGSTNVVKTDSGKLTYKTAARGSTAVSYNTLTTPRGGQYQLTLSDGTKVWLNAASSLTYPTAFTSKDREVTVTGEAYFEVATDKTRPFHVKVNDQDIRVLGTHFNVNAYPDEAATTTTLLEGSVQVTRTGQSVTLRPGQQAQALSTLRVKDGVDLDQVVAWKNGLFSFTDADLPTVMRQLTRWYDVEVAYEGIIPKREFNGKIGKMLTLDQLLKVLATTTRFHYTIVGKKLTIQP